MIPKPTSVASAPRGTQPDVMTWTFPSGQRLEDLFSTPISEMGFPTATHTDLPKPQALPAELDRPTREELHAATADRRSFDLNGEQFVLDATSISAFMSCPRRYYYSIVLGLTEPKRSEHLDFGIAYQAGLEVYDRAIAKGQDYEQSLRDALWTALRLGVHLPRLSTDVAEGAKATVKTYGNLAKAVVWHIEQFRVDNMRTAILANGEAAVEHSFLFEAPFGDGYMLSGHFDRVIVAGDASDPETPGYILDHKTTKSALSSDYFGKFTPDPQISQYTYAGKVVIGRPILGVVIDACQLLADAPRFQRSIVSRSRGQLDEWMKNLRAVAASMRDAFARRWWPQNEKACFLCPFHNLCRRDPAVRRMIAESEYRVRLWDPAKPRTREDVVWAKTLSS